MLLIRQLDVWRDAAAAVNGVPAIGELDLFIGVVVLALAVVELVERKSSTRRTNVSRWRAGGDAQRQPGL